jgi:transposase-like protein
MSKEESFPTTLQAAVIHFSNFENCRDFMVKLRWSDGKVKCPTCGSDEVGYLPNAKVFKCYQKHARQKFSLKVGTIFEDSPIALEKWLPVMWMLVNAKNGISSWEVHRAIGVTQKTAWFMLQRCRLAMQDELAGGNLGGEVEIDETFIGGKARNMHKSKKLLFNQRTGGRGMQGGAGKAVVMGILQRGGTVRASVVPDRTSASIQPIVRGNVDAGTKIYSDEHGHHWRMSEFEHEIVNHLEKYVDGNIHTNGLENFWSLLKRTLSGTYVSVEPFHLFRYVDEQAFRYNNRKPLDDAGRFRYAMRKIVGKRLTYSELIGKEQTEQGPNQDTTEVPF